jgi:hypothetical protein
MEVRSAVSKPTFVEVEDGYARLGPFPLQSFMAYLASAWFSPCSAPPSCYPLHLSETHIRKESGSSSRRGSGSRTSGRESATRVDVPATRATVSAITRPTTQGPRARARATRVTVAGVQMEGGLAPTSDENAACLSLGLLLRVQLLQGCESVVRARSFGLDWCCSVWPRRLL